MSILADFINRNAEAINKRDWYTVRRNFENELDYNNKLKLVKVLLKNGIDLEESFKLEFKSGVVTIHLTFNDLKNLYDKEIAPSRRDQIDFDSFVECLRDPDNVVEQWSYGDYIDDYEGPDLNKTNQDLYNDLVARGADSADLTNAIRTGIRDGVTVGVADEIYRAAKSALDDIFADATVEVEDDVNLSISYPVDKLIEEYTEAMRNLDEDVDYGLPFLSEALRYVVSEYYEFFEPQYGFNGFDNQAYQSAIEDELTALSDKLKQGVKDENI